MSQKGVTLTIAAAIAAYLDTVRLARSQNTVRTYRNALRSFQKTLKARRRDPAEVGLSALSEDAIAWFAADLKQLAPATESLYLTAVTNFFQYLAAEQLAEVNLPRLRMLVRQRARRPGYRLPQFPREDIESLLSFALSLATAQAEHPADRLRNLRDGAFLVVLADTGLRVHEACALRRGQMDWLELKAMILGKGDVQAVIRFSERSVSMLREYLQLRASLDGASGRPLGSLPLFARHDRGAGRKVLPITTTTGRNIVSERVRQALGTAAVGKITPHSLRHYFVTSILRGSGGNLKLAQKLARHRNIGVTQRYAHLSDEELDQGYHEIFDVS